MEAESQSGANDPMIRPAIASAHINQLLAEQRMRAAMPSRRTGTNGIDRATQLEAAGSIEGVTVTLGY